VKVNKKIALFLVLSFFYIGVHAEAKIPMPTSGQVVLVGKVSLSCSIDDFYAKTFKGGNADAPDFISIIPAKNSCGISKGSVRGANGGEFFFIPYDKGSRIAIRIKGFNYMLFNIEEAYLMLPFWKEFTLPLDGQFFYIGSFVYNVDSKTFDVKSVDSVDEFDAAQIAANKYFDAEIPLRRVPLNDLAEY